MPQPLLCLVMIVKNEARGIVQTLRSVRDHIDRWCILDTGSTDGTQDLIREAFDWTPGKLPGDLYEGPFVDFATTRNEALSLADRNATGARPVWRLMLSGDAVVEHAECLPGLVRAADAEGSVAARLCVRTGGLTYFKTKLTKAGAGCSFGGVTHEAMNVPDGLTTYDGLDAQAQGLAVRYDEPASEDRTARWTLDTELLEGELRGLSPEERRTRTRTVFYLAQSYECLGNNARAAELYAERVTMGGYADEAFLAQLRIARCQWRMGGREQGVVQAYRAAHALDPERAEPTFELAQFYKAHGAWFSAHDEAQKAVAIRTPTTAKLFLHHEVYEWRARDLAAITAFRCGLFAESASLCQALLASAHLPDAERERVTMNLTHALNRREDSARNGARP